MPGIKHTHRSRWYTAKFGGIGFIRDETKDVSEEAAEWLLQFDEFVRAENAPDPTPSLKSALDGTVEGLRGDLSSGEFDRRLAELETLEKRNQNRATALDAIDERRDTLEVGKD